MSNQVNSTKVVTGKVRFCYANVFEPTAMNEGDTPKYKTAFLFLRAIRLLLTKSRKP